MNHKIAALVPEEITQLQRQLEQFRSSRPARTRLPESLWQAAVELARQHGIYTVAHPLRLDYTRLKQRLGGMPSQPRKQNKPAFVERIGDCTAALSSEGTQAIPTNFRVVAQRGVRPMT